MGSLEVTYCINMEDSQLLRHGGESVVGIIECFNHQMLGVGSSGWQRGLRGCNDSGPRAGRGCGEGRWCCWVGE